MDQAIREALSWGGKQHIFLDPNNYRVGYKALRRLFSEYVCPDDYETVFAGANAVYGWMPTIMKNGVVFDDWKVCTKALKNLLEAETWTAATKIIIGTPDVLCLVNGSLVGSSKFLHFLNPKVLPIWDSNIGRVFGANNDYAVNRPSSYLTYGKKLNEAIEEGVDYPDRYNDFAGDNISSVRRLEHLLFLYGQFR